MNDSNDSDFSHYLSGKALYGDDFSDDAIAAWYADEAEGYYNLTETYADDYSYYYHAINSALGFDLLSNQPVAHALGIGSARGDELIPIASRLRQLTILDPSEKFGLHPALANIAHRYEKPQPSGDLPFDGDTIQLITCFGVLHHIPNVSHVMAEMHRVLSAGGNLLLREPIVSMGDWRSNRTGLTRRERGIPAHFLDSVIEKLGFSVRSRQPCMFPVVQRIAPRLGIEPYNSRVVTRIDNLLCRATEFNAIYHRTTFLSRFAPTSLFYVLVKN